MTIAAAQVEFQKDSDPVEQYRAGLAAALAGGGYHLANELGTHPDTPEAHGWREHRFQDKDGESHTSWQTTPGSKCIGWLTNSGQLYLEPHNSLAAAREACGRCNVTLPVTPADLRKLLKHRGMLLTTEPKRQHLTVRHTLAGQRREVIHVPVEFIFGTQTDEDQPSTALTASRFAELIGSDFHPQPQEEMPHSSIPPAISNVFEHIWELGQCAKELVNDARWQLMGCEEIPRPELRYDQIRSLATALGSICNDIQEIIDEDSDNHLEA